MGHNLVGGRMERLILDTNIYGLLFTDSAFHELHVLIEKHKEEIRVYGFSIIRKELKQAPKRVIEGVNVRASLLRAYSSFVKKEYPFEEKFQKIAEDYFGEYTHLRGKYSYQELLPDFLIVACASVHQIPIVVSEDNHTLASELAQQAYEMVNRKRGLSLPEFVRYEQFKQKLLHLGRLSNPLIDSSHKLWILLCSFNIFPRISFSSLYGVYFPSHNAFKEQLLYKDYG